MDISDFYQTFFDEADELLADMEQHLLDLQPDDPDSEQLNAIFRAAHSIKGGAGTFGFTVLQETTHLMENLLDEARRGEMRLNTDIINLFLETKDIMQEQLTAYKNSEEPDAASFDYICQALRQLALEAKQQNVSADPAACPVPEQVKPPAAGADQLAGNANASANAGANSSTHANTIPADHRWRITLSQLKAGEADLLLEELKNLGQVSEITKQPHQLSVMLESTVSADDISAVLCFVLEPEQIVFSAAQLAAGSAAKATDVATTEQATDAAVSASATSATTADITSITTTSTTGTAITTPVTPPVAASVPKPVTKSVAAPAIAPASAAQPASVVPPAARTPVAAHNAKESKSTRERENTSIRVAVEKVDQLINQVGELVITQSMLQQLSTALDPVIHGDLLASMSQLQRNARDLQESVMSIRMMPMEYVFSRFPRLVRDLAGKLNKQVELTMQGSSTELDKSLIERIIDPLTHLVRNSLDHGIEMPETRQQTGKTASGNILLSAEHQGGNICIEVSDDGAGMNRERILAKAISQGMPVSESMSDDEVWMLIFAPGFSTAEIVTDVSGRGVGMDVVKRNIQEMGGHVEIQSKQGQGTRVRILLPLTLAILDGMSVKVHGEVFILPLNAVMESLQPRKQDLHPLTGGEQMLEVRGEYLPLVELWKVFDVQGAKTDPTQGIVVILQGAGYRYALLVDQLIGQHQVVVKNLESNYRKVAGISAATILGDGSVALIVDVAALPELNREQQNIVRGLAQTAA